MTVWMAAALIWCLALGALLYGRLGPSTARWSRAIAFKPKEEMSREHLFGCLLSANFALLLRDNFNQLASALSERHVEKILAEHWGIASQSDCFHMIEARLEGLGDMSPSEKRAIAAWLMGERRRSNEYAALEDACMFMTHRARVASVDELRHDRLSVLAWDIQQLACLIRLALAVGYVSRDHAQTVLSILATRARLHYASWKDYSLSALVGLGMRGSLEIFDTTEWAQFARTHSVFLNERYSPTRSALPWGDSGQHPSGIDRTVLGRALAAAA